MKFATRSRPAADLPGLRATLRADRRTRAVLPRLRPGDIVLVDHVDMDRSTAQALVDAGVSGVLNASAMISGRYPNLGPQVLADAGVLIVDQLGTDVFRSLRDGAGVRVDAGEVFVGEEQLAAGRVVDSGLIADQLAEARAGLGHQLDSFTHNSTEFLRREQDLLLHGKGVPRLATRIADRPVVVVVRGHDFASELKGVRDFIREQNPALIGVDGGADALLAAGFSPDVVVLSAGAAGEDEPSAKAVRAASDVVVRVDRGAARGVTERWEKLGVQPLRFESSATTEDAALILADAGHASVIVGVGMHADLDEFLDRQRAGLASTYLTRLKLGPRLVDAAAVPTLYSGRVRPRHVFAVLLAGLVALAAAVGTTPVGQEWGDTLVSGSTDLIDYLQGKLS